MSVHIDLYRKCNRKVPIDSITTVVLMLARRGVATTVVAPLTNAGRLRDELLHSLKCGHCGPFSVMIDHNSATFQIGE